MGFAGHLHLPVLLAGLCTAEAERLLVKMDSLYKDHLRDFGDTLLLGYTSSNYTKVTHLHAGDRYVKAAAFRFFVPVGENLNLDLFALATGLCKPYTKHTSQGCTMSLARSKGITAWLVSRLLLAGLFEATCNLGLAVVAVNGNWPLVSAGYRVCGVQGTA